MSLGFSTKPLYDNYQLLSPDGKLMALIDVKKAKWYLERDLASIPVDNPMAVQLKFIPKDLGYHDVPYFLQGIQNICVVCGTTEQLSKHHVVPHLFIRALPEYYKERNHYDVLPMCVKCHEEYELRARELRDELFPQYTEVLDESHPTNCDISHARRCASALQKHYVDIPEQKRKDLYKLACDVFHLDNPTVEELYNHSEKAYRELRAQYKINIRNAVQVFIQELVDSGELANFYMKWREHFIAVMLPKYMPENWDTNFILWDGID